MVGVECIEMRFEKVGEKHVRTDGCDANGRSRLAVEGGGALTGGPIT